MITFRVGLVVAMARPSVENAAAFNQWIYDIQPCRSLEITLR